MRVFLNGNAGIEEVNQGITRYKTDQLEITYLANDYIYLLSDAPFNHAYFSVNKPNAVPCNISVQYYSQGGWVDAVHINDETAQLSKSGAIEFTPNKEKSWKISGNISEVEGLEAFTAYDLYAVRVSFDSDFTDPISFNYIGHCFSDDVDLYSEFPLFNDVDFLNAFRTGKTNWEEQAIKAADIIISDMISRSIINTSSQIINRATVRNASIQKTAELIFNSFGSDYTQQKIDTRKEYNHRMDMKIFKVDTNNNAIEQQVEKFSTSGWLSR